MGAIAVHSAGILLFRRGEVSATGGLEVMLVLPGGPFFAGKDLGSWSIPKGEYDPSVEDALAAARREFGEETGTELGDGPYAELGVVEQRRGKIVRAFAFEGDFDVEDLASNDFELEWPPRSGRVQRYPEVDRAEWFAANEARTRILPAQAEFIDRLLEALSAEEGSRSSG